jgi:hypothetical protein
MTSEYKLVGLSKPRSTTLEFFDKEECFNAPFHGDHGGLWAYCKSNWDTVNLKALVKHDGLDASGYPINPVVININPI